MASTANASLYLQLSGESLSVVDKNGNTYEYDRL
jgi:hypothetical protein